MAWIGFLCSVDAYGTPALPQLSLAGHEYEDPGVVLILMAEEGKGSPNLYKHKTGPMT